MAFGHKAASAALIGISLFALSACANIPFIGGEEERPDCGDRSFTLYFDPSSETLPSTAGPIITQVREAYEACRAQGGALVRASVRAFPDTGEDGTAADHAALLRAQTVVTALVEAGLPGARVVGLSHNVSEDHPNTVMRRHADIELDLE